MEFTWYGITAGNNCPPRRIENYSFIYIASGSGSFHIRGKDFLLQPGELFVLFPGDIHSYYSDRDNPWQLFWFGITGYPISGMMEKSGISRNYPIVNTAPHPEIKGIFTDIIAFLANREPGYEFFALSRFLSLLGLFSTSSPQASAGYKAKEDRINEAQRFLEMNYVYEIDAVTLAARFGYTRTYFSTLFKEAAGKTPIEYLTSIRLKKAAQLLKNSQLSIQEIAGSVGIKDSFYFSKLFHRHYGQTPSKYRGSGAK